MTIALLWTSALAASAQNIIHVPVDQPTIQAGINAAKNGDTVLVAPGTYNEDIDFKGKAITVTSGARSFSDPATAATVIQGSGNGPVVIFQTQETLASVLSGFTVQGGTSGIYLPGTSATLSNNIITANLCGIVATEANASPLISGNEITHSGTYSGPIALPTCIPLDQPYARLIAGDFAISLYEAGNVQIVGNTIENNGAHVNDGGEPDLVDGGGAITAASMVNPTTLLVENNIIRNNYGTFNPPLYASSIWHVKIVQNLVYGNISSQGEGGVFSIVDEFFAPKGLTYSLVVANNTIYGNINEVDAQKHPAWTGNQAEFGAQTGQSIAPLSVENSLFIATDPYGTVTCGAGPGNTLIATNNDAFYAGGSHSLECGTTGNGNLAADPQFLNPAAGDFHTQRTSPVVGAGDVNALGLPPTDLDGKNRTVCGSVDMGVYQIHPIPPIALSSSANPSVGGNLVTFSAHVTGNCNTPTGIISFFDGPTQIGSGTLDTSGNTTFSTASLTVGSHTITATYPGDFNFDASTATPITQVVTGYPTTTTLLSVSPNPASAFQTITLAALVSSHFGTPSGTISFLANKTLLTTANLDASGHATATTATLGAGTYTITAIYNPSILFAGSTSNGILEVINGAPTTTSLSSSPNPSTFGQSVTLIAAVTLPQSTTIPTGTVSFRDGTALLGSSTLTPAGIATFSTAALAIGTHTITAVYAGSTNDNSSTAPAVLQVVNLAPTQVTLTADPNPANFGQTVSLVATVTSATPGLPNPAGSITFADQFGTLGTLSLTTGQAVFTTSTLGLGTHTITASFSGGGNYAPTISPALTEVIEGHDFGLALKPLTLTLVAGAQGNATVTLTSIGSYTGTLNLTATQIPANATLTFHPQTVTLAAGGSATAQLTLETASLPPGYAIARARRAAPGAIAAILALPLLLFRRRRPLYAFVISFAAVTSLLGCTNISYPLVKTRPGTYTIPISAVDSTSQIAHTVNLTLIVTE